MRPLIERNNQTGRFQKVTPATVGARLAAKKRQEADATRRANARKRGYRGPFTRHELARAEEGASS